MEISIFNVDSKPFCVWEVNLKEKNLDYIKSIDHNFFSYQVAVHAEKIDSDDRLNAALSLRIAFYHGMETLFSLICAMLQAPDCVYGWMLKYTLSDLRKVIRGIHQKKRGFHHRWQTDQRITWQLISASVHSHSNADPKRVEETSKLFADYWQKLCNVFLEEKNINEYNSIKHGYRAKSGGFTIAVGEEETYGVPAPADKMVSLGGSTYGSTFLVADQIEGEKIKGDPNFTTKSHSLNWDPEGLAYSLNLISESINNVKSHLLILNGASPSEVTFTRPQDSNYFELPWKNPIGVTSSSFNLVLDTSRIKKFTK